MGRWNPRTALLLALGIAPAASFADGSDVFWEVAGQHNTVYLLGSVHMLPGADHALPAVADSAYVDAEVLVEELDLFSAAGEFFSADGMKQQLLPEGRNLSEVLGPELNAKLRTVAQPLGFDPDFFSRMQPWYVATLISSLQLVKAGYSPQDGVDMQLAERAHRDSKPIVGLETAVQQLGFLASMPLEEQSRYLAAVLDGEDGPEELGKLTDAWRRGDLAALEALIKEDVDDSPEFYQRLIGDRNHNWLPRIEQMLAEPTDKDYLVVVGAAHMLGPQGLVELLRAKGYKVVRK